MARTLAGEPELLVLDEPNAGVDLANQEAIAATLASLAGAGATIIVVLHELGHLADVIQRSVVLRDGRVDYDGPPHEHPTEHESFLAHQHHHRRLTPPAVRPGVEAPLDRPT
jgi:zinc transport system ATP-binding protein